MIVKTVIEAMTAIKAIKAIEAIKAKKVREDIYPWGEKRKIAVTTACPEGVWVFRGGINKN